MHGQLVSGYHILQNPWLKSVFKKWPYSSATPNRNFLTTGWFTSREWQATVCRPHLALHLSSYSMRDKNGLYVCKWLGKKSSVFYDIWDLHEIQPSEPTQRSKSTAALRYGRAASTTAAFAPPRQSWEVARDYMATKPNILLIWSFREKVGWPSIL